MPTWWLLTFYGAVAFGLVYWFHYHEYGVGKSQPEVYAEQMAAVEAERTVVTDEALDAMAQDEAAVAAGEKIFTTQCYACHDKGQGRVGLGSNLTDKYWVRGGAPTDIHAVITNGIPEKGMTPWGAILGEEGVSQVTAYVLTIRNTNLEGGKPVEEDAKPYEP